VLLNMNAWIAWPKLTHVSIIGLERHSARKVTITRFLLVVLVALNHGRGRAEDRRPRKPSHCPSPLSSTKTAWSFAASIGAASLSRRRVRVSSR